MREVMHRAPGVAASEIEDVILGGHAEAEQGLNVARIASLRAGLPVEASAVTINRFCASGLQAIAFAADRIKGGSAGAIIAGGTESMSLVPMGGNKVAPNPSLVDTYPDVYLTTGLVAENHARDYAITREAQDAFRASQPPARACGARRGKIPRRNHRHRRLRVGRGPAPRHVAGRALEAAAGVPRQRDRDGGNSSQTSDGAAAVLVTSDAFARERGLKPLARFVAYATAGVAPERFGTGPVPAIQKVLKLAGLSMNDIDLIELNEAFASQVLACLRELPMDETRLNVNGGAIALGHPLGCTGAKLTTTLIYEMHRRQARYGLVTMCVGGGMGAAGILERIA